MTDAPAAPPVPESPPAVLPTVRQEALLVAGVCAAMMVCIGFEVWDVLDRAAQRQRPQFPILVYVAVLLNVFGNAAWISMDRRRRGREVGAWRFATIFLGPAVLCVYILLEYRERALFHLPILVIVYAVPWFGTGLAVAQLHRVWS